MHEPDLTNNPSALPARKEAFDTLTVELVRECLPKNLTVCATQELTDKLNNISSDPEFGRMIRENFISYTKVLGEGKFKIEDYLNAVVYVSYKLMGYNNDEAYVRTFPHRFQEMTERGVDQRTRSAYVAAFHRGKLVNLILEQTLIPTHILCQDLHLESIKTLAMLMKTSTSERIQMESALGLEQALRPPQSKDVNLRISTQETEGISDLKDMMRQFASQQIKAIESGTTAREIAEQKLIEGEYTEVGNDQAANA